jgi:TonB family protein
VSAVRITLRAPRAQVAHWLSMGSFSVLVHGIVFATVVLLPQLFHNGSRFPEVTTVDLVSLPAGLPGPPAETLGGASPSPPAPAPAAAPSRPPATVKIPAKPEPQVPKAKPPKKAQTPKPSAEKTEPKPKTPPSESAQVSASSGKETGGAPGGSNPGTSKEAGGLPGGSGGGGGSGFLDDASFAYGWYLSNMSSILGRNWARPIKPDLDRTLRAVVHFRVLKDGTLADIDLEQPSGDPTLDRSALRAVQDSNPLPPLPYQYGKDSLGVHFFFDLKPD